MLSTKHTDNMVTVPSRRENKLKYTNNATFYMKQDYQLLDK